MAPSVTLLGLSRRSFIAFVLVCLVALGLPVAAGAAASSGSSARVSTTMTPTPDPWVTGVSPGAGPKAGGETVTITGQRFMGVTSVRFDGVAGKQLHVINDTKLTVRTPAHATGTYRVRLIAPGRSSLRNAKALYTFVTTPVVDNLAPHGGPLTGGTSVSITGRGFTDVTSVRFDGVAGTNLEVLNNSTLSVDSPAHAAGSVRVRIIKRGSSSEKSDAAQFTYQTAPTVTGLSPASTGAGSGATVTITGTGFVNVQDVYFGTAWVSLYDVVSPTQITAVVNGQPAGTVNATVITDGGTSAASSANEFTFVPAPTITEIAPDTGGTGGYDTVTITGTSFTGTTAVTLGGEAVDSFTVQSDTEISIVTAPVASAGPVDVEITTSFGSVLEEDGFTYVAPPVITNILPTSGVIAGGTSVVITGTGFSGVTDVLFGGSFVTSGSDVTDTSMTVTTPAHAIGSVSVTVITPYGSVTVPNAFTYVDP